MSRETEDEMTPVERLDALRSGGALDRMPCLLFVDGLKCELTGATCHDYWHSAKTIVEVETAAFDRWGQDQVVIGPNSVGITEALGGSFTYPAHGVPAEGEACMREYDALDAMEPLEASDNARLRPFFDAAGELVDTIGETVPVEVSIGGPLTIAAFLRGTERLLRDFARRPEEVGRLLRLIVDAEKSCVDAAAAKGAGIYMADPVANPALIGVRRYEQFVFPITIELTRYVLERCGRGVTLHMCGRTEGLWNLFGQYPLLALSLDNAVDLDSAIAKLGDRFMLAGNVDPVGIVSRGDDESIRADVARCVRSGGKSPRGFYLAPGCDIPAATDLRRVDVFMDACRQAGHAVGVRPDGDYDGRREVEGHTPRKVQS